MTNAQEEKRIREKLSRQKTTWETLVHLERADAQLVISPVRISRDMATAGMAIKKAIKFLEKEVDC